jgi:putative methyltransferase
MPQNDRLSVLISEPNSNSELIPYLPYVWATLKSYFERHASDAATCEWLPPVFESKSAAELLAPYETTTVDVLGLSCYVWNWDLQLEIARSVKARNPSCVVVAGGPHLDYKDPDFLRKHPFLDVVVENDGEIPFTRILETIRRGESDFSSIPGLHLPEPGSRSMISTGKPEVNTRFVHSPYIDQREYLEGLIARRPPNSFRVAWETNRGCPFSCSFCDWGSNTMSKVRRFDMERLEAEIDWFGRVGIPFIFLVDANFGILPRDPEIAELIVKTRETYGSPRGLYYSPAKNNPDRSLAIARTFARSKFVVTHSLAIQHTRPEVLAATERSNISPEKQKAVAKALQADGVPVDVQLILGIPGDTYDLFKDCLTDLMEWGIHDQYMIYPYNLLPNAPAAEKSFRERWQIVTSDLTTPGFSTKCFKGQTDGYVKSTLITASKTFTSDDWVRMNVFAALTVAMHGRGITRLLAMYLRRTQGVSYKAFYDDLMESFFRGVGPQGDIARTLEEHFYSVLHDGHVWNHLPVERLPSFPEMLYAARWVHVQVGLEMAGFWEALRSHLLARHGFAAPLADLIHYQQNVLITPDYDRNRGKSFSTRFDWPSYFRAALEGDETDVLPEPTDLVAARVTISDQAGGRWNNVPLDWDALEGEDRWIAWIERIAVGRAGVEWTHFKQLAVEAAGAVRPWRSAAA